MRTPYKGINRYKTFLKAGKIIAGKISRLEGVVGILGTGAIGRRFGDEYSDLDLIVYAHQEAVKRLSRLVSIGWIGHKGLDFDIEVESYERALKAKSPSAYWTQIKRWDQQNSKILHDAANRIENLLQVKLVYPETEQKRLMKKYKSEVHEYLVFFPAMWAERGQLYNVVDALFRAVQSMVLWIYARNKVFEPYIPKWLFYHLETRTVPEHIYLGILTEVFTRPPKSIINAMKIRKRLLSLCKQIGLEFEVYSLSEAQIKTRENWKKVSKETRELLSW